MKRSALAMLLVLGPSAVRAELTFTGYMVAPNRPLFVLSLDREKTSGWLMLGQSYEGFALASFDPKTEYLTVTKDGQSQSLRLVEAKVQAATEDSKAPLRTLKGFALAYEVAKRGDETMALLLQRYQEALRASGGGDKALAALDYLRLQVERVATERAAKLLNEK